jgi:branched-chain amino acid transport system ATP-binding protein
MGKTTFLKTLIGLLRPTGGNVELHGQNITRMPAFRRNLSGMGYVPQGRDIFPNLTVYDNLRIALAMHKVDEGKVLEEVLETFPRLKPLLERSGRVLSGGEQQILALARCLCGGPSLLLLDEPTEGIQPSIVEEIIEILHGLRKSRNLTVILVEQNLEFIGALSQRIHIIQRGQLVNEVSPEQLADPELIREFVGMGG